MRKPLDAWQPLPAERKLAEEMASGLIVQIGDGTLPPADLPLDDPRVIRTSFLRALILGHVRGHKPQDRGIRVQGAYLLGNGAREAETRGLDLEGYDLPADIALIACRIPDLLLLRSARLGTVILNESDLGAGFAADRLVARGSLLLRGLSARGQLRLVSARIEGDLDCSRGRLVPSGKDATLDLDGADVGGSVFLRRLVSEGEVRLVGGSLKGDLDCSGAQFSAGRDGFALSLNRARISGCLFLREGAPASGIFDFSNARIDQIADHPSAWPQLPGNLLLNGCRYGAFTGTGAGVDSAARIRWLALQDESRWGAEFWPQPWEECARVLREMGDGAAAREVLIEKEKRQRAARRARVWRTGYHEDALWLHLWDRVLAVTVRYGRMPLLAMVWLAAAWFVGALVFAEAQSRDALKPNLPQIQRAPEWVLCGADAGQGVALAGQPPAQGLRVPGESRIACYHRQPEGAGHPRFNAAIYSADALIPVVSLEMQSYWIPDDDLPFGAMARGYLWVHITAGWFLTLLAVAGFSGLIKTDNTT
ncbi:hypothetical protein [Rhodobaculum claviforme]|uniref:Membrane-associated oxidoreductase n=1 Tax=Rhodobaculum claviforme TaxID=1549854 RepID=A0A934TM44_9RHOB|nr:hypothetical protein [Rhodobaculum claviforme]MBK5928654.1 hypothetical protein [Rhodobaculum claviforme]